MTELMEKQIARAQQLKEINGNEYFVFDSNGGLAGSFKTWEEADACRDAYQENFPEKSDGTRVEVYIISPDADYGD